MSNEAASIIGHCNTPTAKQVRHCQQNLSRDGVWAGEEVLRAAASNLSRTIHVYSGVGITWPLVYQPVGETCVTSLLPVILAFYEPGHYMAAVRTQENQRNPTSANNICGSAAATATKKGITIAPTPPIGQPCHQNESILGNALSPILQ